MSVILYNILHISISSLNPLIASKLVMESEKIRKFFSLLRRMTASASKTACSSALKMLDLSGSLVVLVTLPWTTAAATWFPISHQCTIERNLCNGHKTQRTYFCRFQVRCYLWRNDEYCNLYRVSLITREESQELNILRHSFISWWRSPAVEHRSLADVLSLSCARLVADGWPLMWVSHPL